MLRTARLSSSVALSLALAVALVASTLLWNVPLNNDVSWQYWVARQLRGGAQFGREVKEINPPLWFWEAMPLSALADRLGTASAHVAVAAAVARSTLAVLLVGAMIEASVARRLVVLGGLAAALMILPIFDFGEREHFMLLGALPYAALVARRAEGRATGWALALVVGLLAALGFALKPYFVLVPLTLELWLALRLRRGWRPVRTETLALAAAAIAYAEAILIFADRYVTDVLPVARYAYGDFAPPFVTLFTHQLYLPVWLLGGIALALARPHGAQARAAGVATLAFLACYLLQGKGFAYHALPVTVGLVWTLWLMLAEQGPMPAAARTHPLAGLAILAALATSLALGPVRAAALGPPLGRVVDRLPPGTVFAVISAHSWHAFPLVEQRGFVWPLSGGIALLPLPMILREGTGPHATAHGRFIRQWTLDRLVEGLSQCPPRVILVDDPNDSTVLANHGADYLAFLRTDPRMAAILTRYRPLAASGRTSLLVAKPGALPPDTHCASPPLVRTPA